MIGLLLQAWVGVTCALVAFAVVAFAWYRVRGRRRHIGGRRALANVGYAGQSAQFRRLHKRYVAALTLDVCVLGLIGLSAGMLASRPAGEREEAQEPRSRDIVLCLDVSGSMTELDAQILGVFVSFVGELDGDRVGLTIWDSSGVPLFPLTDDYDYARQTLDEISRGLGEYDYSLTVGTFEGDGSSLIGDGLATCTGQFDRLDEDRPRSIVLATDNQLAGNPFLTLDEATALARSRGITVYGLAPSYGIDDPLLDEFEQNVKATGGLFFAVEDESAVESIIEQISEREGALLELPPELVRSDRPTAWVTVGIVVSALLVALGWLVRR